MLWGVLHLWCEAFYPGTLEWYPNPCFGGLTPIHPHFSTIFRRSFWGFYFQGYLPNFTENVDPSPKPNMAQIFGQKYYIYPKNPDMYY